MATTIVSGLNTPSNIIYNDNKLYVFGGNSNGCNVYNTSGTLLTSNFITGNGLTFGMSRFYNNSFYVPSYGSSKIFKYSSSGVVDSAFTLNVGTPIANAIANNILYVSSYASSVVKTFNISTGAAISASFLTASSTVISLATSGTTLYVATEDGKISLYNATTGAAINTSFITTNVGGSLYSMVLDSKYLYTTHNSDGQSKVFNATTGALVTTLLSGITSIRGIALDSSFVYVSQQANPGAVYKIANPYYTPGTILVSELFYPANVLYNDNKLYVFSSEGPPGCNVYDTNGTLITSTFISGYSGANGTPRFYNNSFYVPSYGSSKILKYNSSGVVDNAYTLNVATPIANVIANDILYVSSYASAVVKTFNILTGAAINASLLTTSGTVGSLAISGTTLYVASEDGKISLYNATTGAAINTNFISGVGITYGMILDSKYLYATHYSTGDAKVYNASTGALVATLFSGFTSIRGIVFDSSFVYITTQTARGIFAKIANPYYTASSVGTAPTITSITANNDTSSFSIFFTAGTGGSPAPTTYQYSLNGGSTYINANTTTSPIVISSGILTDVAYQIALIATNAAGNTAASNIVVATLQVPCFLEGSKILRFNLDTYQEEYVAVETLTKDDIIPTSESGYKYIHSIGYKTIAKPKSDPNLSNRLYKFSKPKCKEIFEPLYITGEHCTLHRQISKEKQIEIAEHMGDVYITEEFYRMPACLDDRAEPYDGPDEPVTIWHFALEHENVAHNYGVYANGLLVESCAIESLLEKSGMVLI